MASLCAALSLPSSASELKLKSRALDDFGVEYIELTSPVSSEQSRRDCEIIANLGLRTKILTHVRCNMEDARVAVETGVDGVDVVVSLTMQEKAGQRDSRAYAV